MDILDLDCFTYMCACNKKYITVLKEAIYKKIEGRNRRNFNVHLYHTYIPAIHFKPLFQMLYHIIHMYFYLYTYNIIPPYFHYTTADTTNVLEYDTD